MMKYIWLGIKDYCKDCWHDWLANRLKKFGCKIYDYQPAKNTNLVSGYMIPFVSWKEGNLWHYIQNRRIATRRKKK